MSKGKKGKRHMTTEAPIATVFGGSGFVGRYITQRLARAGWRVRVAVRRPNEAIFVRTYGVVGQVLELQANIRDTPSVRRAVTHSDAVINCVGILAARGRQTFDAVQAEGAARAARISAEEGVRKFVQISAIGADPDSDSEYARTKAEGERAVMEAFHSAVILRPSIMFGVEDEFFNRFASMARLLPFLPVVGPETRFQPVYVDDVAKAAVKAALEDVEPGIYELGGPEAVSFRELMRRMLAIIDRRRPIVSIPFPVARLQASALDFLQSASFGLIGNSLLTRDQVRLLARDNVVSDGSKGFDALGIVPTAMDAVLPGYLFSHRRGGQFAGIKAVADAARQE
jgi:uncharacterized protein YbjT (DUF2867 family)